MALISSAEALGMLEALGGESVIYKTVGTPSHDITTGVVTTPNLRYNIDVLWTQYERSEVDGQVIISGDAHVVADAETFPCVPTVNDQVLRGSELWAVKGIMNQPTDPFVDLQLRRV